MTPPRSSNVAKKSAHSAFTMVELLVVIAIIGVLAALIITSLGASARKARTAGCMSNLKQLGSAMMLYASENNQTLPPNQTSILGRETWIDWIYPYATGVDAKQGWPRVHKVFQCPEMVALRMNKNANQGFAKNFRLSSTPGALGGTDTEYNVMVANSPEASKKILLIDHWDFNADLQRYMNMTSYLNRGISGPARHGGSVSDPKKPGAANALFMDGSVRSIKNTEADLRQYLL